MRQRAGHGTTRCRPDGKARATPGRPVPPPHRPTVTPNDQAGPMALATCSDALPDALPAALPGRWV